MIFLASPNILVGGQADARKLHPCHPPALCALERRRAVLARGVRRLMTGPGKSTARERDGWDDARLVQACREGRRGGLGRPHPALPAADLFDPGALSARSPRMPADIFQAGVSRAVRASCRELRKVEGLRSWLISVTAHQCLPLEAARAPPRRARGRRESRRRRSAPTPDRRRTCSRRRRASRCCATRSRRCRRAAARWSGCCSSPSRRCRMRRWPRRLGLATGSIGFIRGRCLKKLQRALQDAGFDDA